MTTLIVIYLFLREDITHWLLVKSFRKALKRYKRIWHMLDLLTIIFVLATNATLLIAGVKTPYVLFGFTKALIWLRLFGFLKGINLYLTMFGKHINIFFILF